MRIFTQIALLACLSILTGCPDKKESAVHKAESLFQDGDYAAALVRYEALIASEGSVARVGAGWSALRLDQLSLSNQYFTDAALDSLTDGYAGWSVVLWATGSVQQAIDKANFVLRKEPDFELSLDQRVTAAELIWIQASSYYELGNYAATVERIKILEPGFDPDMNASNLAEILAAKLQSLGAAH